MSKNLSDKKTFEKADRLFAEFIHEMDENSTNGVVKKLDPVMIEPLVDHFLGQCDRFEDRMELYERIQVLLSAKFNYALAENRLEISENLEKSIHEKIKEVLKSHLDNAAKFAGFVINWTIVKPVKFIKTFVEPVIANTVLTYSIAVHPPYLNSVEMYDLNAIRPVYNNAEPIDTQSESTVSNPELEIVKNYSDEDLANLTHNTVQTSHAPAQKKVLSSEKIMHTPEPLNASASGENVNPQNVYVDLQRRVVKRSGVLMDSPKDNPISVNRFAGELRPVGDIQRIIAQNDHRIFNCFNTYTKNGPKKNGRISLKFQISSRGVVKDVKVTYNSFTQDLADRVTLQIKTVRFSEVDPKLGDQTVYHTYYF